MRAARKGIAPADRDDYRAQVMPYELSATRRAPRGRYVAPSSVVELEAQDLELIRADDALKLPGKLYIAGDAALLHNSKRVAIVGSRDASEEGRRRAYKLARQLAQAGIVVVSGLAKGIDQAAHAGAIAAGGRTIAVIGTPLEKAYPAEHSELQQAIYREHLLVSQFANGTRTFPSSFVARNRTMALLSHASVVVEAGDTSGSLSQAAETQRCGRPLFFMRSVLATPGLEWPAKFQAAGAIALDSVDQILTQLA